ncbi:hypothetical protein [Runella sp. SP2]|uniref:hypothetical protein n=1 Tax=Runella sp. SP2 TaxID=2268026 RepID=UPI000F099E85|nr:hypothetical protein [Runella sp. SP2]AYQ31355.1 hypothetical protein DTQ70_03820 [Runella sp. SP2]
MKLTQQINYHEAIRRWCARVEDYNENCETFVSKRTSHTPDGEVITKEFVMKKGTLKGSVKATGMHLIALYSQAWGKANAAVHGMARPDDVYVATNRVELGERLSRSGRSCYDHIRKLITVGLIEKYSFCGRQHSFKIWISPKILFGEAETMPEVAAPKTASLAPVRQKMPPIYNPQIQYTTTISADKCGQTLKHDHGNNKDPHSLVQNGQEPASYKPVATETRQGGRAAAEYSELEKMWISLPNYLRNLTTGFWKVAKTQLYPRCQFTEEDQRQAILEIYEGVFGKFALSQSDVAWADYYNELMDRMQLAKRWFDKHPDRSPDMPYKCKKKLGYFDPKNNFGFARTAEWFAKDSLRKRENRVEFLLNSARIDFERWAAGKPRASHIGKDELQLFVYYQNWARTYGKEVEAKFSEQYLEQKARSFEPKKIHRLSIRAQKKQQKDQNPTQIVYVESWMTEFGEGFYSY